MLKKRNMKTYAIALCASVMVGLYASPVWAANVTNKDNNNFTGTNTFTRQVTLSGGAKFDSTSEIKIGSKGLDGVIADEADKAATAAVANKADKADVEANAKAIAAEQARAEKAEKANADAIDAEVKRAKAAEKDNADAIAAEQARAEKAEKANADAIDAETKRAKAAEKVLDDRTAGIERKGDTTTIKDKLNVDKDATFDKNVTIDGKVTAGNDSVVGGVELGNKKAVAENGFEVNSGNKLTNKGITASSADINGNADIQGTLSAANNSMVVTNTATTFEYGSGENKVTIDENGIKVGNNSTHITGNSVWISDATGIEKTRMDTTDVSINHGTGDDTDIIALSELGKQKDLDKDLIAHSEYTSGAAAGTAVGAINAEAAIRKEEVARLDRRITNVEDRLDKVGAMSAAIASLKTMGYDPEAPTEFAMSLGHYRGETGMAMGLFHYPNKDFMLSLSVSTAGDEVMGGIGATWRFGRKSLEKRAEEAKAKKAEEMKAAAEATRVKAQQKRHAAMIQ